MDVNYDVDSYLRLTGHVSVLCFLVVIFASTEPEAAESAVVSDI